MSEFNFFQIFLRNTAFRLTVFYMFFFCIIAGGLTIYIAQFSINLLTHRAKLSLEEEVKYIRGVYDNQGGKFLAQYLKEHLYQPTGFLYYLTDKEGETIEGNIKAIEKGVLDHEGFLDRPFFYQRFGRESFKNFQAIGYVMALPQNIRLLIGRDTEDYDHYKHVLEYACAIAMLVTILVGFIVWLVIGRESLRRLNMISQATERLLKGDLSERLPLSIYKDDFDKLSERLNLMLDRIAELTDNLRYLSDNIAHDLKTPLTRLCNKVENALLENVSAQQYKALLKELLKECEFLIKTFDAILLISKLESKPIDLNKEKINLRCILMDALEIYEDVTKNANIELSLGEVFDCELCVHRQLVAQSIFNIIDNAIKYALPENKNSKIYITMKNVKEKIIIQIEDNGPGISEKDYIKVTERFVRLEKSRTKPGFGIGLSLAKAVMNIHDGQLWFEDAKPGLRVNLSFPMSLSKDMA